jgi:hypothetical protein
VPGGSWAYGRAQYLASVLGWRDDRLLPQPGGFEGFTMSAKWLPPDDLAPAKPVGARALELASHFTRLDPSNLGSPETDHGVASCYEALREEARLNVLIFLLKPIAQFGVPVQPRPAWGLELNLGIVQREKLIHIVSRIEELDPSTRDRHVVRRHHPHSISRLSIERTWRRLLAARDDTEQMHPESRP